MASIPRFLNFLTSVWGNDIPLKNLWTIHIDNLTQIANGVSNILYNTENFNNNRVWPVLNYENSQDQEQGLFLAQKISMPTDGYAFEQSTSTNMNGLRSGYIGSQRMQYKEFGIEFLETNTDIIDHFFRPWIIACAHKGLIEDNDPRTYIKGDLYVSMYTRVNRDLLKTGALIPEWELRKTFKFEGVVPTNVEGDVLRYNAYDSSDLFKTVSFIFKNYYLLNSPFLPYVPGETLEDQNQAYSVAGTIIENTQMAIASRIANANQPLPFSLQNINNGSITQLPDLNFPDIAGAYKPGISTDTTGAFNVGAGLNTGIIPNELNSFDAGGFNPVGMPSVPTIAQLSNELNQPSKFLEGIQGITNTPNNSVDAELLYIQQEELAAQLEPGTPNFKGITPGHLPGEGMSVGQELLNFYNSSKNITSTPTVPPTVPKILPFVEPKK